MNPDYASQSPARYGAVARLLHWLVALLIIVVFALGLSVDAFPHNWEDAIVLVHKDAGVAIIVLALARLVWRQVVPPPAAIGRERRRRSSRAARACRALRADGRRARHRHRAVSPARPGFRLRAVLDPASHGSEPGPVAR